MTMLTSIFYWIARSVLLIRWKMDFHITLDVGLIRVQSLVITGGLSIPKIGATRSGYEAAQQFA